MGIPKGITLIVGGGYHGKSTLLKALELGVYDHVKGDGREFVITDPTAMKIRAEDGRSITNTDISMFINNLPNGKNTVSFDTEDASGSTSQAANVVEAMETDSSLFLIDEDTSATNFMIRDELMQRVVLRDQEPITPFIERIRELLRKDMVFLRPSLLEAVDLISIQQIISFRWISMFQKISLQPPKTQQKISLWFHCLRRNIQILVLTVVSTLEII